MKRVSIAAGFLIFGLQIASADIFGTISFTTPVVTVGSTDSIPVYLTLTLDPSSAPLITDNSGHITDLSQTQVQSNLFGNGNYYDSGNSCQGGGCPISYTYHSSDTFLSNTNEGYSCYGITFFSATSPCGGGTSPYNFNFGPGPGFDFAANLDLLTGSSSTYLFGTFTPAGGNAPAGTYTLPDAFYFMQVYDDSQLDSYGQPIHIADIYSLGDTNGSAGFTANVIATPEPGFYWYLVLSLPLLFVGARRFASRAREN